MTPENYRQYVGMIRLFRMRGTGGATWAGVRGTSVGMAAPTFTNLGSVVIRFLENNRVAERSSLPAIAVYTAPWWGLADIGVDIQVGDMYTNGSIAFTVTGVADTSCGFQVVPVATFSLISVPRLALGGGYRTGLRIGAF